MAGKLGYIFSRSEKLKLFLLMVAIVVGSFLELMGVAVFTPFINIIMEADAIRQNRLLNFFYEALGFESVETYLAAIAGLILFIYVFINVYLAVE